MSDGDKIKEVIKRLSDTLESKNKNYGSSAFSACPFVDISAGDCILIRIGDKVKRLEQLSKRSISSADNESFNDTILDLAGYCVLYLANQESGNKKATNKIIYEPVTILTNNKIEEK